MDAMVASRPTNGMSSTVSAAEVAVPVFDGAKLKRVAGAGALIEAVFYLLQPLAAFVLIPEATQEGFWPSPATMSGGVWQEPYEVAAFGGIAVSAAPFVVLVAMLRAGGATVLDWVDNAFGLVGVTGWVAVAGLSLAQRSLVAASLGDIGGGIW